MDQQLASSPDLQSQVSPETDVTYLDLALIGAALLSTVTSVAYHGWASPGSSLDYTRQISDPHAMIMRDFVAWTAHRQPLAPGGEERLRAFVEQSGWTRHAVNQMSVRLGLVEPPQGQPDQPTTCEEDGRTDLRSDGTDHRREPSPN